MLCPGIGRMADEYGTGSKTGPKASKLQPSPARQQSTMTTEQLLCKPDISSNLRGILKINKRQIQWVNFIWKVKCLLSV